MNVETQLDLNEWEHYYNFTWYVTLFLSVVSVVNHHGARAIGGHYTTFVYHPGIHGWVHLDDSTVKTVNLSQVLKLDHPRVPYLLYYRRVDVTS